MALSASTAFRRVGRCAAAMLAACVVLLAGAASASADATAPTLMFGSWAESSPFAHYDGDTDSDRIFYNPLVVGSGLTATMIARDPETGVNRVDWPTPPLGWTPAGSADTTATDPPGLVATYWNESQDANYPGANFTGTSVQRIDPNIAFNWGAGSPHSFIDPTDFSARWTGKLLAPDTGVYYFQTRANDGVKVRVNNTEVLSFWTGGTQTRTQCLGGISLSAGVKYDIVVEYYEDSTNTAQMELRWRRPTDGALYQTPAAGCDTAPSTRENYANGGMTGPGAAAYPAIPASQFSVGGGAYTRTFGWNALASDGIVNATATNNDTPADTSTDTPIEFVADGDDPVVANFGELTIQSPGWGTTNNNRLNFPQLADFSDAGSSAPGVGLLTRMLQRRDGVADGVGGCNTAAGTWTDIGTPAPTVGFVNNGITVVPSAGTCSEFRYVITDEVGNSLELYASGFKGWDSSAPTVSVVDISEGMNPEYQHVTGPNSVFFNPAQSGTFTVTAQPFDAHSGPWQVRFRVPNPATNWTAPAANVDVFDPGPWTTTYEWTSGAASPGAEAMDVWDYAGQTAAVTTHTITADATAPAAGASSLLYPGPVSAAWHHTTSIPVTMNGTMTDGGAGVYSYQLQRDEVAWSSGTCTFTSTWVDQGAPSLGTFTPPYAYTVPASLGAVPDTGVVDGMCYRYRVLAIDRVGNPGYLPGVNGGITAQVDDMGATAAFVGTPASASGNLTLSGSSADSMSGVARVTVRYEDLANPGVFTTIGFDNTAPAPAWSLAAWDTTSLNGNFRLHLDVTDVAGNVVTDVATHDITLDNQVPTLTHDGFTEGTNPEFQFEDPIAANHRLWVKTNAGASGSVTANFTPSAPLSGIDFITTPGGATDWTPLTATQVEDPGPYTQTYSWIDGAVNFGTRTATARSNSGRTSTPATPFTITADNAAPTGGSATPLPAPGPAWHKNATIDVTVVNRTDASAGIRTQQLERDEVARNAFGTCGGATWPNTFATVIGTPAATLPTTITDTSIVEGMCYRYRVTATDNVSNTGSTAVSATIVRDSTPPIAGLDATPAVIRGNNVALAGPSDDGATDGSTSGVASVTVRWENLDDSTSASLGADTTATNGWTRTWNTTTGATPDGNYRIHVDVIDVATNQVLDAVVRDVVIDNSAPVLALDSFVEGSLPDCQYWSGSPSTAFYFSPTGTGCGSSDFTIRATATDAPGGLAYVRFPATNMIAANIPPDAGDPADDTTGPNPYEMRYTYAAAPLPGSPAAENIVAMGNSGLSTTLGISINRDTVGPTGATLAAPGGTASPAWWTNAANPSVGFDITALADGGSGPRANAQVLERRSAPGPGCTVWSGYTQVGTTGLSAPFADPAPAENTCYQYRLVTYDNVSNPTTLTSGNQARIDRTPPTGTINPVPAYMRGTTNALSGTSADDWSGVASISVRLGAGPATACTPVVAANWTCNFDTTSAPNGATTLVLVVTDRAGNVLSSQTQPTYIDNELPAAAVTLAAGTNPGAQHVVPGPTPRIYVNTNAGSDGSFVATTAATDAFSGIASVSYPSLSTGWTRTPVTGVVTSPGPYTLTYDWTGSGTTAEPGLHSAIAADNASNFVAAPFEVVADIDGPTGVTLDYDDGPTSTPSVTFAAGTDAGAGLSTWRIERRDTAVTGPNTCDTSWTAWATEATDPASSPWTDGNVVLNRCYQYRIVSADRVGNVTTVSDATSDTVSIEPAGIVIVESASSTDVTENGATDTYSVRLRTRPASDVTVTIGTDAQVDTDLPTLMFTTTNWNLARQVVVTAFDDDVDEVPDPNTGTITHAVTSADTDYSFAGADVVANVTDDDTAGFVVSPSAASVDVTEAGPGADTYTIRLASEPTANVVVTLGNADGEVTPSPATLTFAPGNWSAEQTVTVTAVDDDLDEAPTHPGVVSHGVTSSDPLYAPLAISDVTATVTDDDATGITVTPVGALALDEAAVGTTANFTVKLDSEPYGNVSISVTGDVDAGAAPTPLLFTPTTWGDPQTVTMTVVDDLIVEGAHTATTSLVPSSSLDPAYAAVAIAPVVATVADNDVPGIEVDPATVLTVAEGGAGSTYRIRLGSQPIDDVTIAFATGTQLQPIGAITFDAGNWNAYQTLTVDAVQDDVDEVPDPHQVPIVHTVTSPTDTTYDGWSLADQLVDITDDDVAGVIVDELGSVDVDEANLLATDTYTVRLSSEPTGTVTITPDPDAQVSTSPAVTFTAADWSMPKTVTVGAIDDAIDELPIHPGAVALDMSGADPLYAAHVVAPVDVNVADNDTAALVVSPGTLTLDETLPADDTFVVRLASEPTSPVTVTLTPDAQVGATPATLVFTAANWSVDRTVTATAIDDPLVEDPSHAGSIVIGVSAGDAEYLALATETKSATIVDNDVPGVVIDEQGGVDVTEGAGTDQYTIALARQPQGDVDVTVAPDAQVSTSTGTITFTTANWNTPVPVVVTAVDDAVDEASPHDGVLTHAVASADPRWAAVTSAAPVTADVTDNDAAGIVLTASSPYSLSEDTPATTVTYDVVLQSEPTGQVDVALTVPTDLSATPTTLSFTAADWNTVQRVTVSAIDDPITETPVHTRTITHAVTSGDPFYAPVTVAPVAFDVTDNDIPGITVSETLLSATEGGAGDTFSVVLDTQPTGDVTVDLTGTQVGFDVDPLVFTSTTWNAPQVVQVDAIDDAVDEHPDTHAGLVELDATSPDAVYDGWTLADIAVAITDNDTAGVSINPGAPAIAVDETGPTTATYAVELDTEPTDPVTITLGTTDGQTTTDAPFVTFTPGDWNVAKPVVVTAVDDGIDEAPTHPGVVTHAASSLDSHYGGALTIAPQLVDVTDNDTAGILVTPIAGLTLDEASVGTTATFSVVLQSEPLGDVDVQLTTPDGQTTVAPSTLTFTPGDWGTARNVTVTVVDDAVDEGLMHPALVVADASSGVDTAYDAIDPDDVAITVSDDDTAGVIITESAGSTDVDEAGTSDTYLVRLATKPTGAVTIDVTGGFDATTIPGQLTFDDTDWATDKVVTVNGTPDYVVEGAHTQLITHAASGADPNYGAGLTIASVTANVTDDDNAGATITPGSVAVTEGTPGVTATYTVVLDAEPAQDVTITITPVSEVTASMPALLFTPATWADAQTVTVEAIDDLVVEPTTHPGTIQHAMSSSDANFNVAVGDVTANITDNDVPGVTVAPNTLTVSEGGPAASFDVVLDSQPTAPVDVTFSEPGELDPIATVTIAPGDWNVPVSVPVTAFDDAVYEGAHSTTIVVDTTSADGYYATGTLTIDAVDVDIVDNDVAGVLVAPPGGLAGAEGGAPVTYDVSLTSQPTAPVTITLVGDADGTPTPTTLTFDGTNWATPKPVSVAIIDDAIAEGAHVTNVVTSNVGSLDPYYDGMSVPDQSIAVADNDTAGVTFTPATPGPLSISEAGTTASYTVRLTSEPTAPVTIDVAALAGQATVAPATLTFDAADWTTPQAVVVTAVDDQVAENTPHPDALSHTAGGSDLVYAGLSLPDMDLAVDDNDVPGVLIDATLPDTSVTEGGLGDTVNVRLATRPTNVVTVALSSTQVTLGASTLTFTTTDWNTPQPVTVDAIQDDVFEGPHTGTIDALSGSALDPFYVGVAATQHPVSISDDDVAGVVVTQAVPDTLDESDDTAGQTYQVRLQSEPLSSVDVTITPDAQVASATTTLTFLPGTWDDDQPVVVTPVDDAISEAALHPGAVSHDTTSGDAAYATGTLAIDDAEFQVADDDTPGITVTPTAPHAVTEGGVTSTYSIVLESEPTGPVTISPVSTQLEWTAPSITFVPGNWMTPQFVTLRAIDDPVDEASPHSGTIVHGVATGDAGYASVLAADVTADITDNDVSDLVLTPTGGLGVDEAGALPAATYQLTLTSQPTDDVTVTFGLRSPAQLATSVATVVLTDSNWNTGVTVDVTAVQDDVDEASTHTGTITHAMASPDGNYDGESGPDQAVDILDDDTAGIVITPSAGSTDVAEDGLLVDDYTVELASEPTADVTVTMATPGNQVVATPATLTFTSADWDTPKPVAVTAVDDAVVEGAHTGTITHAASSSDASYVIAASPSHDVVANVLDDDIAGITVVPAGGTFEISEDGIADELLVTLDSQPVAPVTIDLGTPDGESTVAPVQVVLDDTTWDTGVGVTVTAVDDGFIEGTHAAGVTFAVDAGSSDPAYAAVTEPNATAQVTDNDAATVTVDLGDGLALDEAAIATTDTFTVQLDASPAVGETVDLALSELAPGGQLTFAPATVTFDDTNWDDPVTVTVTVVNDAVDEAATHTGTIEVAVSSGDTDWTGVTVPDIDADIADDDTAGLTLAPATILLAELGATSQTLDVSLSSKPVGPVQVAVTSDSQVTVGPATLTFDDTDWATPKQVTITAVQDDDDEIDPHPGIVTLDVSSPGAVDPTYDALATATYSVDVADDDTSNVLVAPSSGTTTDEANAGTVVEYSVQLATRPSGTVTVDLAPNGQLELVGSGTLTFLPGAWNTPQFVQLRAFDDDVDEAATHQGSVAIAVSGGDPLYTALTPTALSVDVADDDAAGVSIDPATPLPLDEAGTLPAASYDVTLLSEPTDTVTITIAPDGQVALSGATTLTFDASDWDQPKPVSVTAVDDMVTETAQHQGLVSHTSDSPTDANYAAAATLPIADAEFDITDDDQPGFTFDPVAPAPTVDEAGATSQSYDLSINTVPAGPVTVNFATPSADVTISPASHTFTAGNAATPVTITVTAVNDSLVDPGETATISHAIDPSSHPGYTAASPAISIPDVTVSVTDDDLAELVVVDGGGLSVAELGETTDTFTLALSAEPASNVVVDLAEAGGATQLDTVAPITPATLTFTPADWNDPQTVTVQPQDDAFVEGDPHAAAVGLAIDAAGSSDEFDATTHPNVAVSIDDDDIPNFVVTDPTDMTMFEAASATTQRTINVQLATVPLTPVTFMTVDDAQVDLQSLPSQTLDATNWNTGVDVVVQAHDDLVAETDPHPGTVSFTIDPSSDPGYAGLSISARTFSIADDDLANAALSCQSGPDWSMAGGRLGMAESPGASAHDVVCYVTVGTEPAQDITIDVAVSPSAQLSVDQARVTIPAGSTSAEPITFTATDDALAEADPHPARITFDVQSVDPIYDAKSIPGVDVDIADDDVAGATATPIGPITIAEGGASESVSVVLTSQPTSAVTVTVDGGDQVGATPATLTFLPTNWNVAQPVTVSAIDDAVDEPDGHAGQVTFAFSSNDTSYVGGLLAPVDLAITDNDTAAVVVTPTDGANTVGEAGATDQLSVRLGTRPSAAVTVTLAPDTQVTAAPATLTFLPGDWNDEQVVTLGAVQDAIVEGAHTGSVAMTLASSDTSYAPGSAATPAAQSIAVADDDLAGVVVTETDTSTKLTEAGATDTYTIALAGQPTADVAIAVDGGTQVTGAPASITFTAANWNQPQTVTLTAVQDSIDEPDEHQGEVKHVATTTAAGWAGANVNGLTATITDDDASSVIATQSDNATRVVEGKSKGDSISFALSSQPTADVSIVATGDTQLTVSTKPIVLTAATWKEPVVLQVNAVDDEDVEGDHEGTITFAVTSDDVGYKKATTPAITVAIGDNDVDHTRPTTEDEEDEEQATGRTPRTGVPPATIRPPATDPDDETDVSRTQAGSDRTDAGRTRLPAGVEDVRADTSEQPGGVSTGRRLGGELVAAEEEDDEPMVKSPMARASAWLKDNWKLWAPLLALGTVVAGSGAWLLRGDPVKAAQRAATVKAGAKGARMAGGKAVRPRRIRGGRKKDDDDDEDDADVAKRGGRGRKK